MANEIIFILSYEKRWGSWVIFPYRAEEKGEFYLVHGRYTGEKEEGISPEIRKITALCKKYDSEGLYKYFGRKRYKDERSFVLNETDAYIQENIKPYIEKYVSLV
ncbi:MAG: hypothetical protein LIO65_05595, partial [Odoribacter sp.]|nr:hypothetical protein [Odoribacter sp.]